MEGEIKNVALSSKELSVMSSLPSSVPRMYPARLDWMAAFSFGPLLSAASHSMGFLKLNHPVI